MGTKCRGHVCPAATHYHNDAALNSEFGERTPDERNKLCCEERATCNDYKCPAPYVENLANKALRCQKDSSTCQTILCCQNDETQCMSLPVNFDCGTDMSRDPAKAGDAKGDTPEKHKANCCSKVKVSKCEDYLSSAKNTGDAASNGSRR